MNRSNSAVLLVILVLIFGALMLRHIDVPTYSLEEIRTELSLLCEQYGELRLRGASEAQWQAFEQEAEKKLDPVVSELKRRGKHSWLNQLAMYDLPKAIASRGKTPAIVLERHFSEHDRVLALIQQARQSRDAHGPQDSHNAPASQDGVDPLLVGMVVLDGGLLIAIGYMLFWPVHKRFFVPKDLDSTLRQLDKRIERNPDAARFLGTRARLLADAGRHDEAIADIDRILERHAHGVNVKKWQEFREAVVQKAASRQERREEEKHA